MTERHHLILSHEWLIAREFGRGGRTLDAQEAMQEGWLALVGAAAEWDGQGRFADFAAPRVRSAIRRARRRRDRAWKVEQADEHLELMEGRTERVNVDTHALVRAAMGTVLDEAEREAIRKWMDGDRSGVERDRRLRRRAKDKLRAYLAG